MREDNGRTIDIVDVGNSGTNIEKYSEITLGKEYTIQEFYVNTDQKKLVAVCQKECADNGVIINAIEDVASFRTAVAGLYDDYKGRSDLIKAFIESAEANQ